MFIDKDLINIIEWNFTMILIKLSTRSFMDKLVLKFLTKIELRINSLGKLEEHRQHALQNVRFYTEPW